MGRRQLQEQIGHLREDVRATHEQVDNHGTSLTSSINNVLADLRDENRLLREDVARLVASLDQVRDRLAQERAGASEVLREIETMRREAAAARAAALEAEQRRQQEPDAPPQGDSADDCQQLLEAAAGIAYAEITCHRDTWSFLVERAAQTEHFRLPADVDEDNDGTIEADISGRTLIALIDALWRTKMDASAPAGTRALAIETYRRISAALRDLQPAENGEQPEPRIIIDNRPLKPDANSGGGTPDSGPAPT